ncbi:restriction endonuclease S subunit [Arthrobacter sp. UYEF6]
MHEDWKPTTIGNLATFDNGYPFKPTELDGNGLPVIRIKQLLDPTQVPDKSSALVRPTQIIDSGDLIFSWSATLAARIWDRGPALLNQHLFKVIEVPGVLREFMKLTLEHAIPNMNTHGTTMMHVTKRELVAHKVLLPPLDEQKRIVDAMSAVDAALSDNQQLVQSIGAARSAMLTTLLSQGADSEELPWQERDLSELCDRDGTIQTGPFGSQLHSYDYVDEGTPVVMPTNMWHGRIVLDGIARVKDEDRDRLSRHSLRAGDIVYSRRGDVTKSSLVTEAEAGFLCGTGCLLVRPNSGVNSDWLYHWLNRDSTKKWVIDHAVGATMANLNTKILGRVPVEVPPVATQQSIAELANAFDAIDHEARSSVSKYQALRSQLLSSLLSGHHRIPTSYDEMLGSNPDLVPA